MANKTIDFSKLFGVNTDKGFVVFEWIYSQEFIDDWGHWEDKRPDWDDEQMYIDRVHRPPVLLGGGVTLKLGFKSSTLAETMLEEWQDKVGFENNYEEYTDKNGKTYLVGDVENKLNGRSIILYARPVLHKFLQRYGATYNEYKFYIPDEDISDGLDAKSIAKNFEMVADISDGVIAVMDFAATLYESEDEYYNGGDVLDSSYTGQYIDPDESIQENVIKEMLAELGARPLNMNFIQVSKRPSYDDYEDDF